MVIRAERGHYCASCCHQTADTPASVPGRGLSGWPTACALDEIGEDELWLWRLVMEADRVLAAAPPPPDEDLIAEMEQRLTAACRAEARIQVRVRATEAALARPSSWLRPAHRAALVRHRKEDQSAAMAAAVHRGRIEEVRNRLRTVAAAHHDYLAHHRTVISAGQNARAELERIFDDLIDGYARLPEPPVWFRFGLGFPPPPGTQREWLSQARETLAQRRRLLIEQPKW